MQNPHNPNHPNRPMPTDQVRCASDTLLFHDYYGPSGFGMYTRNLPPETKRVYALYAHHGHNSDKTVSGREGGGRAGAGAGGGEPSNGPNSIQHAIFMHAFVIEHSVVILCTKLHFLCYVLVSISLYCICRPSTRTRVRQCAHCVRARGCMPARPRMHPPPSATCTTAHSHKHPSFKQQR